MSMELPGEIQALVKSVDGAVTSADLDGYERLHKVQNASLRLHTVLEAWSKQQDEERELRRSYAKWLLGGVLLEVIAANAAFFLMGLGYLRVSEWVANTFIVGMFGEITTMSLIVIRYLFPKTGTELLKMIEKL